MKSTSIFNLKAFIYLTLVLSVLIHVVKAQTPARLTIKLNVEGLYQPGGVLSSPLNSSGISSNLMQCDTIELNLAEANYPFNTIYSVKGMLLSNGLAVVEIPAAVLGQSLFVSVKHRNSLETWCKSPVTFTNNTYFNFSSLQQFPQVATNPLSLIAGISAQGGGTVNSDGGSAVTVRGVCWGIIPEPTVALNTKTSDGSGLGYFTSSITGLQPGATYYLRAYATNTVGTAYGEEIIFTTPSLGTGACAGGPSTVTDIDGNSYNVLSIGNQCWTRENLKTSKYRNGDAIPTGLPDAAWGTTTIGAYAVFNNDPANDVVYGKLYNWQAVSDTREICPSGWHVPSETEWTTLADFLGGTIVAGGKMKEVSSLWDSPNTGATNSSGFTGLPGGRRLANGIFYDLGYHGVWWSSTQGSSTNAWCRFLYAYQSNLDPFNVIKSDGFSVRCVRDAGTTGSVPPSVVTSPITNIALNSASGGGEVTNTGGDPVTARGVCWSTSQGPTVGASNTTSDGSGLGSFTSSISGLQPGTVYYVRAYATNGVGTAYGSEISFTTPSLGTGACAGGPSTVTDIDGNSYNVVSIGNQCWMQENLKTTTYRNGDNILTGLSRYDWANTGSGAFAIYDDVLVNNAIYGKLYNWYAVADPRGLCPTGWHVPSEAEWQTLELSLGMLPGDVYLTGARGSAQNVGGKMKAVWQWALPNTGATNTSGFTGLPGGYRTLEQSVYSTGYYGLGYSGMWWTSTLHLGYPYCRALYHNDNNSYVGQNWHNQGGSVRCVRD